MCLILNAQWWNGPPLPRVWLQLLPKIYLCQTYNPNDSISDTHFKSSTKNNWLLVNEIKWHIQRHVQYLKYLPCCLVIWLSSRITINELHIIRLIHILFKIMYQWLHIIFSRHNCPKIWWLIRWSCTIWYFLFQLSLLTLYEKIYWL